MADDGLFKFTYHLLQGNAVTMRCYEHVFLARKAARLVYLIHDEIDIMRMRLGAYFGNVRALGPQPTSRPAAIGILTNNCHSDFHILR